MNDIDAAMERLHKEKVALTIVKNGSTLFETRSHRISGFLDAIDRLDGQLEDSSIADRVAGKAVALLCVYIKAKAVYSDVLSKQAKMVLDENGVKSKWESLVENILNSDRSALCPFEKAAKSISDPVEAYAVFVKLQKALG
jgi:translation elongation factor EF-Ts